MRTPTQYQPPGSTGSATQDPPAPDSPAGPAEQPQLGSADQMVTVALTQDEAALIVALGKLVRKADPPAPHSPPEQRPHGADPD